MHREFVVNVNRGEFGYVKRSVALFNYDISFVYIRFDAFVVISYLMLFDGKMGKLPKTVRFIIKYIKTFY